MYYSAGLPFHLARNPHYVRLYTFAGIAANNMISGYIPPGYHLLRTTLLQKERAHIEKLLLPTKLSWKEKGVTLLVMDEQMHKEGQSLILWQRVKVDQC